MFYTDLDNVGAHRTCSPLHEWHQATPYAVFLDPEETGEIYSGMVLTRTGADTVALADANDEPFGLAALDRNATIDDMRGQGGQVPFAVWQGGPDAYFEVAAPAFDEGQAYTFGTALRADADGKLSSAGAGPVVAEVIRVIADDRLEIRLFAPGSGPSTAVA